MSQKAIFLDRDDTVIDDPGYISEPEQVALLPGAAEAVLQFKRMGYLVIIVTNQSGIARGYMDEKKLEQIHHKLKSLLSAAGASIDGLYYCPYHPDGTIPEYARESSLRKPASGMLRKAAEEMDIDLSRSWMIGDRYRDIEAGKAAGCHTILVDVPGKSPDLTTFGPEPDRKAVNLREAVNIIRMYEFHQKAQAAKKAAQETLQPESPPAVEPAVETESPPLSAKEADRPTEEEPEKKTGPDIDVVEAAPETQAESPVSIVQNEPPETVEQELPMESVERGEPTTIETDAPEEAVEPDEPGVTIEQDEPESARLKFHTVGTAPKYDKPPVGEPAEETHHLLHEILRRVKSSSRYELYDEFSIHKLLAGLGQVLAIGCIVFSLVLWLSPKVGNEPVLMLIGYAIALQLLVISLLMMHRRD
jgi:D,D-heptose 1,7-bisphosphate phosphatase